jgi:hypothetical protein
MPPGKQDGIETLRKMRSVCGCGPGLLAWLHADETAVASAIRELHDAGNEGEKRVVFALAYIFAGLVTRAALAHENRAGVDELAAEALYA